MKKVYCTKCGKKLEDLSAKEMNAIVDKGYAIVCGDCSNDTFTVNTHE